MLNGIGSRFRFRSRSRYASCAFASLTSIAAMRSKHRLPVGVKLGWNQLQAQAYIEACSALRSRAYSDQVVAPLVGLLETACALGPAPSAGLVEDDRRRGTLKLVAEMTASARKLLDHLVGKCDEVQGQDLDIELLVAEGHAGWHPHSHSHASGSGSGKNRLLSGLMP